MDRRNYRWADRLDCSERAIANITLSSKVELGRDERRRRSGRRIIHIFSLSRNGSVAPRARQSSKSRFTGFVGSSDGRGGGL